MPDFGGWKSVMRKVCFAGKRLSVFACVVSRGDGQREGAVCATSMQRSTGLRMADAGSRWQTLSPVEICTTLIIGLYVALAYSPD